MYFQFDPITGRFEAPHPVAFEPVGLGTRGCTICQLKEQQVFACLEVLFAKGSS